MSLLFIDSAVGLAFGKKFTEEEKLAVSGLQGQKSCCNGNYVYDYGKDRPCMYCRGSIYLLEQYPITCPFGPSGHDLQVGGRRGNVLVCIL